MKVEMCFFVNTSNGLEMFIKVVDFPKAPCSYDEVSFSNGLCVVFDGNYDEETDDEEPDQKWTVVGDEAALSMFCSCPNEETDEFDCEEAIRLAIEAGFVRR